MRQFRPVLLVLFAALPACGPPGQTSANPPAPPSEAAPPEAAPQPVEPSAQVVSLVGEWRVAGIDGQSFDEPVGLSLTGDEQQLWSQPRCAGVARAYRVEGQRITFGPTRPPAPAGSPPAPVCAIGLPPRLDEVVRALDNAVNISRTPNNGVLISGPDHSVLLFSQ